MSSLIVVDVGNTRIKWGCCDGTRVVDSISLPPDDELAWQTQSQAWQLERNTVWLVSGVHPPRRDRLATWLRVSFDHVDVLISAKQLPLQVNLSAPDKVGIDRLLNAVAANQRRQPGTAAVLVDAGSAVTVDYLDSSGAFQGGAIFPGFRLMTSALHDYTALLPIVQIDAAVELPGTSTVQAIQAGVYHATLGGIERLSMEYRRRCAVPTEIFLTGGDAKALADQISLPVTLWSEMTLEGIFHSKPRSS